MKHMERYLAATSGKNRKNADSEDHSAADSHEAVHYDNCNVLTNTLNKFGLKSPIRNKSNNSLGPTTSHAVIHNRQSVLSTFSKPASDEFGTCDMSVYDEVTVMEEEEVLEEEVIEEEMEEEVIEEEEDYAWDGSKHSNRSSSRLSQRFPGGRRSMRSVVSAESSDLYEEETVVTASMDSSNPSDHSSRMSFYDEQTVAETVTEEVTVVDGDLDDYNDQGGGGDESHNSDLDSDDGIPEDEDDEEEEEENEGQGFTLAFKRNSASQSRVSDITLDHSTWGQEMDGEFDDDDDDEHHIPGQGEDGYCSQFKEGNFRSSLVSNAPLRLSATATPKNIPVPPSRPPTTNRFLPSNHHKILPFNKFSGIPKPAMNTSTFFPKKKAPANPPRVSIMRQFANQPLPSLKEGSARKERGEKKKKKTKCFDCAGEKKELFLFWERKTTGNEESAPPPAEESKVAAEAPATDPVA